jgi:hypothetical protein
MFTSAQRQGILAEARANIAKHDRTSSSRFDLVYKTKDDARAPAGDDGRASSERSAAVASGSELPWWEWVDRRIEACLEAHDESVGTQVGDFCGPQFMAMKRELELLRREVTQLREQVGLERGLRDLRSEVEDARAQVPKLPAIVEGFERRQERLQREVETTKNKLSRVRVNQSMTDYRLSQLSEATAARSTAIETKIETTVSSFQMREVHPDARAALRDFAAETLKGNRGETIWHFDPGPTQVPLTGVPALGTAAVTRHRKFRACTHKSALCNRAAQSMSLRSESDPFRSFGKRNIILRDLAFDNHRREGDDRHYFFRVDARSFVAFPYLRSKRTCVHKNPAARIFSTHCGDSRVGRGRGRFPRRNRPHSAASPAHQSLVGRFCYLHWHMDVRSDVRSVRVRGSGAQTP